MEKLLLMGINTRVLLDSASKLDNYQTFSVSYFSTLDMKKPYKEKYILKQKSGKSCGIFEESYNLKDLLDLSLEYMEEVDKIILTTGISPNDFKGKYKKYKKKIIGNHNTESIEDKYRFYKKIKNDFLVPKTFKFKYSNDIARDNIDEIVEILKQYDDKSFILKPHEGSGGYGVQLLKYNKEKLLNNNYLEKLFSYYNNQEFLIQEYIEGENISSSVLATKNRSKAIMTSKMLTESDFGDKDSFKYSGNILPYSNILNSEIINDKIINKKTVLNEIAEKIISKFGLIGSNGVDMIIKDENNEESIYIIEVNPRFQGTYESIEKVLGVNLLKAHIKSCEGELINVPKAKCCSIKRIIYTNKRVQVGNLAINNVYDIPYDGVIIEKNQPLATIISYGNSVENVKYKMNKAILEIDENIYS